MTGTSDSDLLGVVALLSLTCIFLAVVLWVHGYSKSNNFGALVAIPGFAFVGAIWTRVTRPTLPVVSFVYIFLKKDSQEDVFLPTNRLCRGNMGFHPPSLSDTQVWSKLVRCGANYLPSQFSVSSHMNPIVPFAPASLPFTKPYWC